MFTKHKLNPLDSSAEFTVPNSFDISSSKTVFVRVRKNSTVEFYSSVDGANWDLLDTVVASDSAESYTLNVGNFQYLNFVSSNDKKVTIFPLTHGLSLDSAPAGSLLQGQAISPSEKASFDSRLVNMQNTSFGFRDLITLPQVAAQAEFDAGPFAANISGKNYMLFFNGGVLHPDYFTLNAADDGRITFDFSVEAGDILEVAIWV